MGSKEPIGRASGFAHFSQVRGVKGYRYLVPGEAVEFEWADGPGQHGREWRSSGSAPSSWGRSDSIRKRRMCVAR